MLVLGHRGARNARFENTMESVLAALDLGLDGVEIDVQGTKDGTPVVHHDADLRRMTGLDLRIADLTWAEIAERTADTPAPVAALANILMLLDGRGWVDIEIKDQRATPAVLSLLALHRDVHRAAVSSFDLGVLEEVVASGRPITRWLNAEDFSDKVLRQANEVGAEALIVPVSLINPRSVRRAHLSGLRIGCWGTDRLIQMTTLKNLGVDIAIPDVPLNVG